MKIYLGVNSDGTEMMSKQKLKRFISYEENKTDVLCFDDTQQPPHWMLDFTGMRVPKNGVFPVNVYLTLPTGSIKRMFGLDLTWEDEFVTVEL